jgi:hypothetical protein
VERHTLNSAKEKRVETLTSQFAKPKMTQEDFEEVLLWLDSVPDGVVPDRDRGAVKYEKIRERIIRIYRTRGCSRADEVADESLERFANKAKKLRLTYKGDPALYIYAIAKRVYREILRAESQTITPPIDRTDSDEVELRHAWLEHCLKLLKPEARDLILRFYFGEKREKIENRKKLAEELGITSRALSLRALHIRQKLYDCVKGYLSGNFPLK